MKRRICWHLDQGAVAAVLRTGRAEITVDPGGLLRGIKATRVTVCAICTEDVLALITDRLTRAPS